MPFPLCIGMIGGGGGGGGDNTVATAGAAAVVDSFVIVSILRWKIRNEILREQQNITNYSFVSIHTLTHNANANASNQFQ